MHARTCVCTLLRKYAFAGLLQSVHIVLCSFACHNLKINDGAIILTEYGHLLGL